MDSGRSDMMDVDGLLIDLDGTVYQGGSLIAGVHDAVAGLRSRRIPFLFSTNTSRKSREDVVNTLGRMGLDIVADEVYTAPIATVEWLKTVGLNRLHLLLSASTWEDFEGFVLTQTAPEAVVVGDMGEGFSFEVLNSAFRSLRQGARLVAVHKNRFWIPEDGPMLDAGPFVAALEYAAQVTATLVGKPAPAFFESAAARLGLNPVRLAVVGDDINSDIAGGNRAGMSTVLVRTGKFDAESLEEAEAGFRPALLVSALPDAINELFPG